MDEEEIFDIGLCIESLNSDLTPVLQSLIDVLDLTIIGRARETGTAYSSVHPYEFMRLEKRED